MNRVPVTKRRRAMRLPEFDYTQPGGYFVTLVCDRRICFFGEIQDIDVVLTPLGHIVREEWQRTPVIRPYVELDEFIVMPNHFHGIIMILDEHTVGATLCVTQEAQIPEKHNPKGTASGSLGAIVGQFKAAVTRRARREGVFSGEHLWQRNYYEHIIRDEEDLHRIREYIEDNPRRWAEDEENPDLHLKYT